MAIDGHTQLYGFFAHPAKHSRSPLMHNLSFEHYGINARYLAFDVAPTDLKSAITSIRTLSMGGANLSLPFKNEVLSLLDELTPRARRIQAVNTIKNLDGHLLGDSTDGAGLFKSLQQAGFQTQGSQVTVLGAGGAGKAIIAAAGDYGVKKLTVFKRRNATFDSLAKWLTQIAEETGVMIEIQDYADTAAMVAAVQASQLVINTTNVGMNSQQLPVPLAVIAALTPQQTVYDVIYTPLTTAFLQQAAQQGCSTYNGLGMLVWQGALAFELWTGQPMPIKKVMQAINAE